MKLTFQFPCAAIAVLALGSCHPVADAANPVAVGNVAWLRDYDSAVAAAKANGKPLFVLFQEVPGCAGCQQFGRDVLGDPKVVKAIEDHFTPLLVHNNAAGKDAELLKKFEEPAWNYQVVRFLDTDGKDLIARKDRVWESPELLQRMKSALTKAGKKVPADFGTATNPATQRVVIAQSCFWTGEMTLGGIDGVKRTEAGYADGNEVTAVDYDPAKISLADLTAKAKAAGVASRVYAAVPDDYRKAPRPPTRSGRSKGPNMSA